MKEYNTTQLNPDTAMERHVYHRDQFAHYLRWTHVLKRARIGMKVLDFGCGSGGLLEVFYRNRFKCEQFLGLDIRKSTIDKVNEKFENVDWANFAAIDLCGEMPEELTKTKYDLICSFEVIEHVGKQNADVFLENLCKFADENTTILLSTPNYDPLVGAAANHIINGQVCEFDHFELQEILESYFDIEQKYGTFASIRDYKPLMNEWQKQYFEFVSSYFDTNILANLMAPMFPAESRNCMWVLKLKK
jgi:2-polyprenyl-3-methyl-5-hydroxy-6-metoxy-1,4-benzoquinol methylase